MVMKNFNHDNAISLIGICLDYNDWMIIVMPYMAHDDLLRYLRNHHDSLNVNQLVQFALNVAQGMLDLYKKYSNRG